MSRNSQQQFSFLDWMNEGGQSNTRTNVLSTSYERVSWVYACINTVATVASSAPLAFYTDVSMSERFRLKDEKHNVVQLFNPPKPPFIPSLRELIFRTFVHLGIQGKVFWVFEKKAGVYATIDLKGNLEAKLYNGNSGRLLGWQESNAMGNTLWMPEQVLPIVYYNPKDLLNTGVPVTGLSPLSPARVSLDQEFNINAWNTSFFKTGMKTPLLLKSKSKLTKEQTADLRKEIVNYYSGIDGAHGALIVSGGIEVEPLSISQKDIDFIEGKKFNREEICSLFGVPPALVGIFEYANFCVTGDTLISLPNGQTKQIIDLKVGDEVLSMGEDSIEVKKITNCWENGVKDIYQVKTGSRTLKCSANHKFYKLTAGINPTYPREKVWEKAEDLKVGDFIAVVSDIPDFKGEYNLPEGLVWQKVRSISLLDPEPTFDLEIEGTHNYFANWMVTHNSNTREQRKIFWENTLLPKMSMILDLVQVNILNRYFPNVYAKWDTSNIYGLKPDASDVANAAKVYFDMGIGVKDLATLLKLPELANFKLEDRTPPAPTAPGGNNNKPIPADNRRPKPGKPIDNPGLPSNVQNAPKKELEVFFTNVLKRFTSSVILVTQRTEKTINKSRWNDEFMSLVLPELEKFCKQNDFPFTNAVDRSNDFVKLLLDGKISLKTVNAESGKFATVLVNAITDSNLKEFKIN